MIAPLFNHHFWFSRLALLFWILLVGGSYAWNMFSVKGQIIDQAYAEARANLNKDISFRRWGTSHGGVYVPLSETQFSVPWLSHISGRDVTTTTGLKLTLLNPATMLRQMMDSYADEYGVRGRIIGLKQLNPANKPDAWEREQLEAFQRHEREEVWSITDIDGEPYLRYLRSMYMEQGCEKCHAILGFKVGDVRGATGLNLPLSGYYQQIAEAQLNLTISHGLILWIGLIGISYASEVVRLRAREREHRDVERAQAEETLRIYANAFEHSGEAIIITDRENHIIDVNMTFSRETGYSLEDVKGRNPRLLSAGTTPLSTYQEMWHGLMHSGFWQGELLGVSKEGKVGPKWTAISAIKNSLGEVDLYIAAYTDISELKSHEARIAELAHNDILTGLLNRFSLTSRLDQVILRANRDQELAAVLFIDLDHFKKINDSYGHLFGDQVLIEVAHRLSSCLRESDICARIGGDEFIIVLPAIKDSNESAAVASNLQQTISSPFYIESTIVELSPSIGISIYPIDGSDSETLLNNADLAMYHAKEHGRNNYQFYTESLLLAVNERLTLELEIRKAMVDGQFELYYQPQVCASDGSLYGVEALVRWNHPLKGVITPDHFISVMEDTGIIIELGEWVIDEACRQLAEWKDQLGLSIRMAVNLSAKQLQSATIVSIVDLTMKKYAIVTGDLELEVTETAAMDDPERAVDQLNALRDLGVGLSIDDFGTGYSSLAYIKRLPVQVLKLDSAFVDDIENDKNDAEISVATISLAHNLGLKVVAEGVETEAQRDFLKKYNCDYLQGYLYSRPLPVAKLTTLIKKHWL